MAANKPSASLTALSRRDKQLLGASLVLVVIAAITHFANSGAIAPFAVSALALAALAALVGRAVDGLGERLGAGATGVVQSALGNIPELLFGIFALRQGLVTVVQAALVGSILSNVLLVLGLAIAVGGLRHGTQRFAAEGPRTISLLLMLSVAVLMVPTFTARLHLPAAAHERALSDVAAIALLAVFVLAIPASLRRSETEAAGDAPEAEARRWPVGLAVALLVAASGAAALVSDWFVAALSPALAALHISESFAGLVIVSIAGNAVENVVGIQLAARNRIDYALSVTLQSPVQIALAVAPILVLISPALGGSALTLVFPTMMVVALAITAIIAVAVVFDGESTWIEGACLIALYAVIAAGFWWG